MRTTAEPPALLRVLAHCNAGDETFELTPTCDGRGREGWLASAGCVDGEPMPTWQAAVESLAERLGKDEAGE